LRIKDVSSWMRENECYHYMIAFVYDGEKQKEREILKDIRLKNMVSVKSRKEKGIEAAGLQTKVKCDDE